jgi:hypothetical protein
MLFTIIYPVAIALQLTAFFSIDRGNQSEQYYVRFDTTILVSRTVKVGKTYVTDNGIDGSKYDAFDFGVLLLCSAYGQPGGASNKSSTPEPATQSQFLEPRNTGSRWRSAQRFDLAQGPRAGEIHADVHRFDEGNRADKR